MDMGDTGAGGALATGAPSPVHKQGEQCWWHQQVLQLSGDHHTERDEPGQTSSQEAKSLSGKEHGMGLGMDTPMTWLR